MGVNVAYYRTWYGGFLATDNQAVTAANFDPFCITAPTDRGLPTSGQQICGLYDVKPALYGQVDNLVTQASHYGKQTEVFQGIDVTLTARFREGAQIQGGLSTGRTVNDTCDFNNLPQVQGLLVQGVDATTLPSLGGSSTNVAVPKTAGFCHISQPWLAGFGFNVVYPLPWNLQSSVIWQDKPGYPITASYVASNAEIRTSLGRNLSECNQTAATCNANRTLALFPPNSIYGDRIRQLDLRFSRIFALMGRSKVQGNFDLYNIFNGSTVLNENTRYSLTNNQWRNVVQIMGGRLLKFSAQLTF